MRSTALIALLLVTTEQAPGVRLKPEWGVVLPEDQSRAFWKPGLCNRPAPGPIESIWTPDGATILRLETVLGSALQRAIEQSNLALVKPTAADFYRQYAGFVVGGKRIVYINGVHAHAVDRIPGGPNSWRIQALLPCDGGMLFFGAEFNVETGMVSAIIFNGGGRGRAANTLQRRRTWTAHDLSESYGVSFRGTACRSVDGGTIPFNRR